MRATIFMAAPFKSHFGLFQWAYSYLFLNESGPKSIKKWSAFFNDFKSSQFNSPIHAPSTNALFLSCEAEQALQNPGQNPIQPFVKLF